jgi:hypothetical protein
MRRILTMKGMLRIGRIQRMRGDTKDGENILVRILRMGMRLRMGRILKVIVSRYEYFLKAYNNK